MRSTIEHIPNTEVAELCTIVEEVSAMTEEVQVLPIPTGEGTTKAAEVVSVEPIVVIFQEFSPVMFEAAVPPSHENVL